MKHNRYIPQTNDFSGGIIRGLMSIKPDGSAEGVTLVNGIEKSDEIESDYMKQLHELEEQKRKSRTPSINEMFSETFEVDNIFAMWEKEGLYPSDEEFSSYRKNAKSTFILSYYDRKLKEFRKKYEAVFNETALKDTRKSEKVVLSRGMAVPISMVSAIPKRNINGKKKKVKTVDYAIALSTKAKVKNIIDKLFHNRKVPSRSILGKVASKIYDDEIKTFFYQYIAEKRKSISQHREATTKETIKPHSNPKAQKQKKKQKPSQTMSNPPRYAGVSYDIEYNHPSRRKPKYGYARDRFGRIQERDHYVEGHDVNPYTSNNSLYDREDDTSSAYGGWD